MLGVELRQERVEAFDQRLGFRDGLPAFLNLLGELVAFLADECQLVLRAIHRRVVGAAVCHAGILEERLVLRAVILAFKLIGPLVQLVTEIFQHVGNPFVPGLFGQAIAFFGLGANLVGKISHCLVTPPRGACFAVAGKNRCPIPKRKPKN